MRAWPLAALAALFAAAAALILWFAGRNETLPATGLRRLPKPKICALRCGSTRMRLARA